MNENLKHYRLFIRMLLDVNWTKDFLFLLGISFMSTFQVLGNAIDFREDSLRLAALYEKINDLPQGEDLDHLMQGMVESITYQQDYWQARFALKIALYYGVMTGRPDSLYKYALKAENKFGEIGLHLQQARSMMFLGIAEFQLGHEEPAMEWYTKAGNMYQQIGADSLLASLYINIGHSIKEIDPPLYIEYMKKANQLSRQYNEPRQEAITCLGLTDIYIDEDKPDSAITYINRALDLAEELQDNQILSYCYRNRAIISKSDANTPEVIRNYRLAIETTDNMRDKSIFCTQLGEFYTKIGQYQSADIIFSRAEEIAKDIGATQLLETIYGAWRLPLEQSGQLEKALAMSRSYIDLKDSLHNENIRTTVAELTSKYQIEVKEKENQQLLATNMEQDLNITKLNLANKNRLVLILVLGTGLIAVYFYYRSRQKLNKQKLQIAQQESMIQKQQYAALQKDQELIAIKSIVKGQEQERGRVAKELHDGLGGIFSTIKISLDHVTKNSERLDEHKLIMHSRSLVDKAAKELRRVAQNMMPSTLHKFGLVVALEDLIAEHNMAGDINLEFQHYRLDLDISDDISLSIYRIIQELLHNAIKHANATEILLQLVQREDQLEIVVEDNGKGYNTEQKSAGSGLLNIQSRLRYLNGDMKIDAQQGNGVSISIEIPLSEIVETKSMISNSDDPR